MHYVREEKIICLLLSLSMVLWLITISEPYITNFPTDTFFYSKSLPVYYWAGMVVNILILILIFSLESKKSVFDVLFISILVAYLFGTPCFIYSNARMLDVHYYLIYTVDLLLRNQYSDRFGVYLIDFPLATTFFYMDTVVLNVPSLIFAKYYPMLLLFVTSLFIYVSSKKIVSDSAIFSSVGFLSLAIIQEFRLCPQSYVLMIFAAFLFVLIWAFNGQYLDIKISLLILLWISIILAHPSTPMINIASSLIAIVVYWILETKRNRIFSLKRFNFKVFHQRLKSLMIFSIIYIAYIVYKSQFLLGEVARKLELVIYDVLYGDIIYIPAPQVITPSFSYIIIYYLRWTELMGMIFLAIISFVIITKGKNYGEIYFARLLLAVFLGYIGFSVMLIASGKSGASYGPDRSLIFALFPCSILLAIAMSTNQTKKIYSIAKSLLLIFVSLSLMLIPLTQYGSDPYNFISNSEQAGMNFILRNPGSSINPFDFFKGEFGYSPYMNYWHNLFELKQQSGLRYKNSFSKQHAIYSSGECKIYIVR
jgi:hypothetical protein